MNKTLRLTRPAHTMNIEELKGQLKSLSKSSANKKIIIDFFTTANEVFYLTTASTQTLIDGYNKLTRMIEKVALVESDILMSLTNTYTLISYLHTYNDNISILKSIEDNKTNFDKFLKQSRKDIN